MSYNPNTGGLSNINVSAGTTSNNLSNVVFNNSNGVTFGLNGSTVTASAAGGAGLTNINISGGTTSQNLSNFVFSNSNGVSFGLNGSTMTGSVATSLTNINVSAGTTSNNLSAVVFSNSNNFTFGLNGSTITGSYTVPTVTNSSFSVQDSATTINPVNRIAFSTGNNITATLSTGAGSATVGFSHNLAGTSTGFAGANISMSMTHNSSGLNISASVAAPGGGAGATLSRFHMPFDGATTIGAPIVNSASIVYVPMMQNVSGTRLDIMGSVSVASAANTSSAGLLYTMSVVIHTKNGLTLSSLSSATTAATHNWQSNSTGSMSGVRIFTVPININATPGNYYVAVQLSTRATGHSGAATTSLGNTISMYGVATAINGAFTINSFGVDTNSSTGWFIRGMNSSTGNITQISLSNLTVVGTQQNRANIAIRIEA